MTRVSNQRVCREGAALPVVSADGGQCDPAICALITNSGHACSQGLATEVLTIFQDAIYDDL